MLEIYEEKAKILTEALPYIKNYSDEIIVIKCDENLTENKELTKMVMDDIILLNTVGIKTILVHGGKKEILNMMEKLGKEPQYIGNNLVLDNEAMDIIQMTLDGKINKYIVNAIESAGGKGLGVSGIDGHLIIAEKIDEKYGNLGKIVEIKEELLLDILEKGYVPVVSPVGCDDSGNYYFINPDEVTSSIGSKLKAKSIFIMMDKMGILKDKNDINSLVAEVNLSGINALKKEGVIEKELEKSVDACVEAIRQGVEKAFILDGSISHSLLIEILSDAGIGTMIVGI